MAGRIHAQLPAQIYCGDFCRPDVAAGAYQIDVRNLLDIYQLMKVEEGRTQVVEGSNHSQPLLPLQLRVLPEHVWPLTEVDSLVFPHNERK